MRIVAGEWRGRTLLAPKGADTRPTSDRVREAVFSALQSRMGSLAGAAVLDPFAGSGALVFEALSRGADSAVAIDQDRAARDAIARNAVALGCSDSITTLGGDAFRLARGGLHGGAFTLLFLDPPYKIVPALVSQLMEDLAESGALAPGAVVVYEHASRAVPVWPEGFAVTGERTYGTTAISYATYEGKRLT
ncbi:MAG: 16S rRNA (guanine(966)-N(2))-methyltransferase RsmD [Actinomycetota bacterium]|nr:16S rRNA (guanine(966)-N(2))-methyltransferase RsmD [Actinomycetota bacterium]